MRSSAGVVLLIVVTGALAGCSGKPTILGGEEAPPAVEPLASKLWTYSSPAVNATPYVRDYQGLADHPKDPAGPDFFQGLPGGPSQGPFQTCCLYSWVRAPDLFTLDELAVIRVTLNWTNEQADQANLDVAVCVIWFCGFAEMPDQTNVLGAHSESFDLVTGGRTEFGGWYGDGVPTVGARYSNGIFTTGVPFTVHVEVVPVDDALAFIDPYEVTVPANATLQAELVGPLRGTELTAGLMVYGPEDRPIAYHELTGADGSLHDLGHGEGTYVVAPFAYGGTFVRLKVNATEAPTPLRRLEETFGTVVVASMDDPSQKQGTFTFESPPGSLDTFPFFIADAGGQMAMDQTQSTISLTSSTGVVADVNAYLVGASVPQFGTFCFTCNAGVEWFPANYVDDDGAYEVAYSNAGATGRFVLFTATYQR